MYVCVYVCLDWLCKEKELVICEACARRNGRWRRESSFGSRGARGVQCTFKYRIHCGRSKASLRWVGDLGGVSCIIIMTSRLFHQLHAGASPSPPLLSSKRDVWFGLPHGVHVWAPGSNGMKWHSSLFGWVVGVEDLWCVLGVDDWAAVAVAAAVVPLWKLAGRRFMCM